MTKRFTSRIYKLRRAESKCLLNIDARKIITGDQRLQLGGRKGWPIAKDGIKAQ
ncbi:MAG: hypothetical protein JWR21_10, partial [Herminiimonas sp.]|nr:hypothetical protein [Herminiimonas sp.]